jgi:hypothetical protein
MTRPATPVLARADHPRPAAADAPDAKPATPRRGLKPRRRLFVSLLALFGLWVALLVWMYADTVYPVRHGRDGAVSPAAPEPGARQGQ